MASTETKKLILDFAECRDLISLTEFDKIDFYDFGWIMQIGKLIKMKHELNAHKAETTHSQALLHDVYYSFISSLSLFDSSKTFSRIIDYINTYNAVIQPLINENKQYKQ